MSSTSPLVSTRRRMAFHPLPIAAVDRLTPDAVAVTFEVPPELQEEFTFVAGQHITLRREVGGEEIRRSYSLCVPEGSPRLRVAIKRIPGGALSTLALEGLQPGDVVDVLTPIGHFTSGFTPDRSLHYAAIAAGSGITPILSLITTALAVEGESRVTLVYGNRTAESVIFLDELADLKDRHPDRLHLCHVLSREVGEVELFTGRLDRERLRRLFGTILAPSTVDEWFLCGPYGMVVGAQEVLAEYGVEEQKIRTELFYAGELPAPAPDAAAESSTATSEVTIVLDGRATTLPVHPGERILDAALRVRRELPFACKGGVCSTCRARVVEGEVRMERNYALEPDELEAGYVLTCQSHPATDTVTLDFDA
jgi:ring-1,2-phenylacetyl-CoA epoxidase subunit PaaE